MSTQKNFMIIDQNHLNWRRNSLTVFFILSNLRYLEKGNIHFTVWQHSMWQYTQQLYKNMNDYYPTNCIANKCRIISPLIKLTTNSYSPVHSKIRQHYQVVLKARYKKGGKNWEPHTIIATISLLPILCKL